MAHSSSFLFQVPFVVYPPDLFNVTFAPDFSTDNSPIHQFIQTHLRDFDRFVFLFSEIDKKILSHLYIKDLLTGTEILQKDLLVGHLYPHLLDSRGEATPFDGWFYFLEHDDRLVQFYGFTPKQARIFFSKTDIETPKTCLIFINLDRICYQLDLLLEFHTSLLPILTPWCGYGFFTQNPQSSMFYSWLAGLLEKRSDFIPEKKIKLNDGSRKLEWEILSVADINLEFGKDITISKKQKEKIDKELDEFPEKDFLFSDSPIEMKGYKIDRLKQSPEGKNAWYNMRRLTLAMLITLRLSLKQKILVISDTFEKEMWEAFCKEYQFFDYPEKLTPEFLSVDEIHRLDKGLLQTHEQIILDLGDELTPWVSQPFIENLLNLIAIMRYLAPEKSISFIRPILIEEIVIKQILDHPPIPFHLESLNSKKKQEELLFATILLILTKRRHKTEFYNLFKNYWTILFISEKYLNKIPNYVKELRCLGLVDRRHFQITKLGEWFLENKLFIHTFRGFMNEMLLPLFSQRLQQPIGQELFKHFYFAATEWLFETTSYYGFTATKWAILHSAIIYTYHQTKNFAEGLFDEVNDLIINFYDKEKKSLLSNEDYFGKKIKQFERASLKPPSPPSYRKIYWGEVLVKAVYDINKWLNKLAREVEKEFLPSELPYFPIRAKARTAAEHYKKINEESYVRVVKRIFQQAPTSRQLAAFSKEERENLLKKIIDLKQRLLLQEIKVKQNKACMVLIKKSPYSAYQDEISSKYFYLTYTCQECLYFDKKKKDCLFFSQLQAITKRKIPRMWQERVDKQFSTKIACVFFRSIKPVMIKWPKNSLFQCLHCGKQLSLPSIGNKKVKCTCETIFQCFPHEDENIYLLKMYLSDDHSIIQDFELIIPYVTTNYLLRLQKASPFPESRIYNPQTDPPIHKLKQKSPKEYLFIKDSDKLTYNPKINLNELAVAHEKGEGDKHDLKLIHWIDTQKKSKLFFGIIKNHPHIKFNFRTHNCNLLREDVAQIHLSESSIPTLNILHERKRPNIPNPEIFPLHEIISVFNVGKPRITPILQKYGVEVYNKSVKGVRSEPEQKIIDALNLEGVRPILREIHLLGLFFSVINATSQLCGLILSQGKRVSAEMAYQILFRQKKLIFRSSKQIYRYYFNYEESPKQRSSFEAWFFRPFAEGLRFFVQQIQHQNAPMIQQPYGRMIARMVHPKLKQEIEAFGAFTPFDSALNTMNRTLRNTLRLWNAKQGFGFNTVPLFSHITKDKPGLSGHLDLEETGRIITRLILAEAIANGEINRRHFERRLTKINYQPYFIPRDWTTKKLRFDFVHNRTLRKTKLYYANKWQSYANAHKQHVANLQECLERCLNINTAKERQKSLMKKYLPLIYKPRLVSQEAKVILDNLYNLFDYCWVKWIDKSFTRANLGFGDKIYPLIDEDLIKRIRKTVS